MSDGAPLFKTRTQARRSLWARLMIVTNEVTNLWPFLVEKAERPDLCDQLVSIQRDLLAFQVAAHDHPESTLSEADQPDQSSAQTF